MKHIEKFEGEQIRHVYDSEHEVWYFSIIDVVKALTDSPSPAAYWRKLKQRLKDEGNETVTNCHGLKMIAPDGKNRMTDVATVDVLLRIIQSIPSPKAEPIKQWLAQVGYERMKEMEDPSIAFDRARELYKQHGYSDKWIEQRMRSIETRNKLTDYWREHNISEDKEYATLTNIIHQEWTGITIKQHKNMKGLKSQNLRDHMTEEELLFTQLAELSTRKIAESKKATGFDENADAAHKGGGIAKDARQNLELQTGRSVISENNFLPSKENKKLN